MIRLLSLCVLGTLVVTVAGCSQYHTRAQGPFARPAKMEPPPPYGTVSPFKPNASASDELPVPPQPPDSDNAVPPFRKKPPQPKPQVPAPNLPAPKPPTVTQSPSKNLSELKSLVATASAAWKALDTFEATLTRREINPQGAATSEVVLFQFRKEPMSVFTRTTSENGKGREVVYNPTKHGDKLHLMLGHGDHKLFKAGFVVPPVSPDDERVKEKARYSIRDTGFGRHVNKLTDLVAQMEAGKLPPETLTAHGTVKREEYPYPLASVTHNLRPGDDPLFPKGGSRTYFFDLKDKSPSYGFPVLILATDTTGKEAEYYLFEKMKNPANLTEADFNPDRLGKKK